MKRENVEAKRRREMKRRVSNGTIWRSAVAATGERESAEGGSGSRARTAYVRLTRKPVAPPLLLLLLLLAPPVVVVVVVVVAARTKADVPHELRKDGGRPLAGGA